MDALDAKYPFFASAREAVASAGVSLPDLVAADAPAVERARERVERALLEGTVAAESGAFPGESAYDVQAELLSYPIARILVSLLDSDPAIEKYAAAEAATAMERVRRDLEADDELRSVSSATVGSAARRSRWRSASRTVVTSSSSTETASAAGVFLNRSRANAAPISAASRVSATSWVRITCAPRSTAIEVAASDTGSASSVVRPAIVFKKLLRLIETSSGRPYPRNSRRRWNVSWSSSWVFASDQPPNAGSRIVLSVNPFIESAS